MTTTTTENPPCRAVEGCTRKARSRKALACHTHYDYHRRHGVYEAPSRDAQPMGDCKATNCTREARTHKHRLCSTHENRMRAHGTTETAADRYYDAEPLARYAERRGISLFLTEPTISETRLDNIACKTLGVHPATIYGDTYFSLA